MASFSNRYLHHLVVKEPHTDLLIQLTTCSGDGVPAYRGQFGIFSKTERAWITIATDHCTVRRSSNTSQLLEERYPHVFFYCLRHINPLGECLERLRRETLTKTELLDLWDTIQKPIPRTLYFTGAEDLNVRFEEE